MAMATTRGENGEFCIIVAFVTRSVFRTFLLRAASFGNRRFLVLDARRISKFFAVVMTSVTQCN